MSTIGTVAVNLKAKTSVFDKKIKKSRKNLYGFAQSAEKFRNRLVGLAGAAVGAAGVAGLGLMVKSSMQNIDAMGKLSDRIGESTENLIALGHAAEIAGSSKENLTKSMEMMTRRLGEAVQNLGQAKYGLESMGVGLDEILDKKPAEQFELISKKIMELPTAAERAAAANNMLGRSGKDLLNLMERVADEGIAGVREEAEKLGITFSRLDSAKVEVANDAMTRLKTVMSGVVQKLAVSLAPYIELVSDKFVNMGTNGVNAGVVISKAFKGVGYAIASIMKVFDVVKAAFQVWIGMIFKGIGKLLELLGKFSDEAKVWGAAFQEESANLYAKAESGVGRDRMAEVDQLYGRIDKRIGDLKIELAGKAELRAKAKPEIKKTPEFEALAKEALRLKESLKTPVEKFKEFRDKLDKMVKAVDETGNALLTRAEADKLLAEKSKELLKTPKSKEATKFLEGQFESINQGRVSVASLQGGGLSPLLMVQKEHLQVAKNQLTEAKKTNTNFENVESLDV